MFSSLWIVLDTLFTLYNSSSSKEICSKLAFLFPCENHRSMSRLLTSSIFYRLTRPASNWIWIDSLSSSCKRHHGTKVFMKPNSNIYSITFYDTSKFRVFDMSSMTKSLCDIHWNPNVNSKVSIGLRSYATRWKFSSSFYHKLRLSQI